MMKCWLSEWLEFLFPEPVEVDGEPCASIPDSGGADPLKSVSGKQTSAPPHDWYAPLPKPPEYLRNTYEPCPAAVEEAERLVRSRR